MEKKQKRTGSTHIQDLFQKYRDTLKPPQKTVIRVFVEVVKDLYSFRIPEDAVSYVPHTRLLHITRGGVLRNEVLLNKEEIITHMKGRLGETNAPRDIL